MLVMNLESPVSPMKKNEPSRKLWSFVVFVDNNPLMYYPYFFRTKARCKATAQILCDILAGNRICVYDSRHYPALFEDLKPAPNGTKG